MARACQIRPAVVVASSAEPNGLAEFRLRQGTRRIEGVALSAAAAQARDPETAPAALNSSASVRAMRAPDIPMGCPRLIAPPLTLTLSSGHLELALDWMATCANASFISNRSTSAGVEALLGQGLPDGVGRLRLQGRVGPGDVAGLPDLGQDR